MTDDFSQFTPTPGASNVPFHDGEGGKGQGETRARSCTRGSGERSESEGFPVSIVSLGILPIARNIFEVQGLDWQLPGHGVAYSDCGSWRARGCMHVEDHPTMTLDGLKGAQIVVEWYKRSCFRAECPVCYESWAGREAGKIAHRLSFKRNGKVIHVVVSPSDSDVFSLPYDKLRAKCYRIVKMHGFRGGSCIFHPFREDDQGLWRFSPHFHLIGYGWIVETAKGYHDHGWIVKNLGSRESVVATALYQLSHAGINADRHTVTWFGSFAQIKLKTPPVGEKEHVCPVCGAELVELIYVGRESDLGDRQVDVWFYSSPELWFERQMGSARWR